MAQPEPEPPPSSEVSPGPGGLPAIETPEEERKRNRWLLIRETLAFQAKMLLQVHDELVFETPKEELDALKEMVFDEMPNALELDVTLKVDGKWGYTWGDME